MRNSVTPPGIWLACILTKEDMFPAERGFNLNSHHKGRIMVDGRHMPEYLGLPGSDLVMCMESMVIDGPLTILQWRNPSSNDIQ